MSKIITRCVWPSIPVRSFDWEAYRDGTEDIESAPIGRGESEQEAIQDLLEQEEEI